MLDFPDLNTHKPLTRRPTTMTPSQPLRIGVLGCARIVRRAIAGALDPNKPTRSRLTRFEAIAGRDGKLAAEWAAEFGVPRSYGSYEELISDPNVDAVYIPLPNELHRPWALRAAMAGKHVLCEKPLALDVADAEAIAHGCRAAGVVLMEAFMWRHHPRVALAKRMLADGKLGTLRYVKMDFSFVIDQTDWRLDATRGGGALYDLGCYGINISRLFTGAEPTEIHARARYFKPDVDMSLGMQLHFPGDVIALLDASFECAGRNRIELVGTKGSLEFPSGVLPAEQATLIYRTDADVETITLPPADQYAEMIDCFARSVAAKQLEAPAEDGLANMRVLQAVRDAAAK
jgi:xylose dehydrogenase (NAD/NADP)